MRRAIRTFERVLVLLAAFVVSMLVAEACTPSQRRAVVHVVADNCERLELPAPVCVAIEDLGPLLAVLLAAQREGRDAEVEIRDSGGVSHVYIVPLARIPGAVGAVTGAAVGAANRSAVPKGSNHLGIPEGSR